MVVLQDFKKSGKLNRANPCPARVLVLLLSFLVMMDMAGDVFSNFLALLKSASICICGR